MKLSDEEKYYRVVYATGYVEGFWAMPHQVAFEDGCVSVRSNHPDNSHVIGRYQHYLSCTQTEFKRGKATVRLVEQSGGIPGMWTVTYHTEDGEMGEVVFDGTEAERESHVYVRRRFLDFECEGHDHGTGGGATGGETVQ